MRDLLPIVKFFVLQSKQKFMLQRKMRAYGKGQNFVKIALADFTIFKEDYKRAYLIIIK